VRKCEHGVEQGRFCARCSTKPSNKIPYCYSRAEVIALNPVRAKQGLPPLKEGDSYR